jgi:hypothetical protein
MEQDGISLDLFSVEMNITDVPMVILGQNAEYCDL